MTDLNKFTHAERIAAVSSRMLADEAPLATLCWRNFDVYYGAGSGDTVKVVVPGVTTAASREVGSHADYETGKLDETSIDVKLTAEAYSAVPLTLAEADLELADFSRQVLLPQARTVGALIEREIAKALAAVPISEAITYNAADPRAAVIRARAAIRANGAPSALPLQVLAGSNVYADMLLMNQIEDGKIADLPVVESTAVPADALHIFAPEALALALRAPAPSPQAAQASSVQAENGLPVTTFQGWNAANGVTTSVVTTFVGVHSMPLLVPDYEDGTMRQVDHGAHVSVDTTPTA